MSDDTLEHADECFGCGWSFSDGGTDPRTWIETSGPHRGEQVTYCEVCMHMSCSVTHRSTERNRDLGMIANLVIERCRR